MNMILLLVGMMTCSFFSFPDHDLVFLHIVFLNLVCLFHLFAASAFMEPLKEWMYIDKVLSLRGYYFY